MPDMLTLAQRTLRFWHAPEHFSPFDVEQALDQATASKQPYCTIYTDANDQDLPWLNIAKRHALKLNPNANYRYRLYFNIFKSAEAVDALRSVFRGEPPVNNFAEQLTCYGSVEIIGDGRLLHGTLALSTLPWAVGYLSLGDVDERLKEPDWACRFSGYASGLFRDFAEEADRLEVHDTPVDVQVLQRLLRGVITSTGWEPQRTEALAYCIAIEERRRGRRTTNAPSEDEPLDDTAILNSFYIGDLEHVHRAVAKGDVGKALGAYLSEKEITRKFDLDEKPQLMRQLEPRLMPAGRWLSKDEHHQSLMQQAAINIVLETLKNDAGLFSVNGPPGTGKTTMLRDMIAAIIVERAEALAQFNSPNQAFQPVDDVPVGSGRTITLYKPDPRITGFEIVVASSNNGAVQNITEEIPAGDAVADSYREDARYFESVAANVITARKQQLPPWGMVAAVLGNSANRAAFVDRFWFDEPDEDEPTRISLRHHLSNVSTTQDAWETERREFNAALKRVRELLARRQEWADALHKRAELEAHVRQAQARLQDAQTRFNYAETAHERAGDGLRAAAEEVEERRKNIESIALSKPSWFAYLLARLFTQRAVIEYTERMARAQRELEAAREFSSQAKQRKAEAERELTARRDSATEAAAALQRVSESYRRNERLILDGKRALGEAFGDEEWWSRDEKELQLRAPWVDEYLNQARAALFTRAMRLHQTFVEIAKSKFRSNLGLWVTAQRGGLPTDKAHLINYLWQTFFLVVPVVSTTFASVSRMFRPLGREAIGWLLIDEAGQATPQAAVGALWRVRRAIVVGDPLQIEPVFNIEKSLVERMRGHYQIAAHWSPLTASAQTLADRANPYGAYISDADETLWVGCPLRVHRRCIQPMFDISNRVAYAGKMVLATQPPAHDTFALGESRWIHVPGECESGHWVAAQGERILQMLRAATENIGDAQGALPRLFIISPFRDVADNLRLSSSTEAASGVRTTAPQQAKSGNGQSGQSGRCIRFKVKRRMR